MCRRGLCGTCDAIVALTASLTRSANLNPLSVLFLSDTYPGHHNFADGVLAAIERKRPVDCTIIRSRAAPNIRMRLVRPMTRGGSLGLKTALALGYGINPARLPNAELVLSGGGETLAANVACARLLGAENIFCGSLRGGMTADQFSLVINSYDDIGGLGNHIGTLKPSIFSASIFSRPEPYTPFTQDAPPERAGLLLGGDSGLIRYRDSEWIDLRDRIAAISRSTNMRWIISTSRRTPKHVAEMFVSLADDPTIVDTLIDFRTAGPGSLFDLFDRSQIAVATSDSSSMVSEAIAVRLPVIAVHPQQYVFKPEEEAYRKKLQSLGWLRDCPIDELNTANFFDLLKQIAPMPGDNLELLSESIKTKVPSLFS